MEGGRWSEGGREDVLCAVCCVLCAVCCVLCAVCGVLCAGHGVVCMAGGHAMGTRADVVLGQPAARPPAGIREQSVPGLRKRHAAAPLRRAPGKHPRPRPRPRPPRPAPPRPPTLDRNTVLTAGLCLKACRMRVRSWWPVAP